MLEEAARLGLTGWVRNTWGRTVEVVAAGEPPLLESLLARLHEGPRLARVEHLSVDWEAPRGEFTDFRVTGCAAAPRAWRLSMAVQSGA